MLLPSSSARSSSSPRSTRICDFGHAQSQSLTLLICAAANSWRMDLRSKHLDSMQWRVSMAAVELNYPVDFSKIMEFEGFGRRAKVTNNIKNGLKETVENDLSSNFSLLQYLKFMARWEQKKSVGGGKKKEVKETGLGLSFTKDENFKEWYFEEHMQYCVDHPEEISKLAKVKAQVSEVKGSMMENIEKVLDCGEKIELLVDKTENLRSQAQDFRQQGTKMRRKMCLQNMKIELIVLGILIALILIIVLSVCHGFKC
ncbi:Synaptobrevin-like - like 4 [Theobroma cacao]|nr:Synaptobrevin-like - like 4 [Theobroma cacao]